MMSISNCLPLCIQRNNSLHIATENVNEQKLVLHISHYVEVLQGTYILIKLHLMNIFSPILGNTEQRFK